MGGAAVKAPAASAEADRPDRGGLKALSSDLSVSSRYHRPPKKLEEDYNVHTDVLGTGYNGSVFKATGKHRPGIFAVKGFRLDGIHATKKAELRSEVEIFLAMDHPHVARLVDVYEGDKQLFLVMECMEGGELFERVQKMKTFSEKDSAHSVWQMLLAVNYIHKHGVVHRDLKLENFLYERKDNDHLKLIDFGFSKVHEGDNKMQLSCGTLAYVAPEVLHKSYTSQCDLWSMGVIAFILLLGYMPFAGADEVAKNNIIFGNFKKKKPHWDRISRLSKEFLLALLDVKPERRLTAEQALKHPWIAKRDQTGRRYVTPLGEISDKKEGAIAGLNVDEGTVSALCSFAQSSRFRRACMSLMAWSLTAEERSQVRDCFVELDIHREGTVKLEDFKTVLVERFQFDEERTRHIVQSLAVTSKEVIHYSEFLAAMVSTRISLNEDHFQATFRRFDTDSKGYLTAKDLEKVLGDSFNKQEISQVISSMDAGSKGEVQYEQFVEYLRGDQDAGEEGSKSTSTFAHERSGPNSSSADQIEPPQGGSDKGHADELSRVISCVNPGQNVATSQVSSEDKRAKPPSGSTSKSCAIQ